MLSHETQKATEDITRKIAALQQDAVSCFAAVQRITDVITVIRPLFGEGGFKRLMTEGTWFTNCHYPYSYTLTAPGHTSLSTGASSTATTEDSSPISSGRPSRT